MKSKLPKSPCGRIRLTRTFDDRRPRGSQKQVRGDGNLKPRPQSGPSSGRPRNDAPWVGLARHTGRGTDGTIG